MRCQVPGTPTGEHVGHTQALLALGFWVTAGSQKERRQQGPRSHLLPLAPGLRRTRGSRLGWEPRQMKGWDRRGKGR